MCSSDLCSQADVAGIGREREWSVLSRECEHWLAHERCTKRLEGFLFCIAPRESSMGLGEVRERLRDGRKVGNERSVVSCGAEKTSHLSNVVRRTAAWPRSWLGRERSRRD